MVLNFVTIRINVLVNEIVLFGEIKLILPDKFIYLLFGCTSSFFLIASINRNDHLMPTLFIAVSVKAYLGFIFFTTPAKRVRVILQT